MLPAVPRLVSCSACLDAVDRLGWTAGMSATSFGVRIGVRVDDAALLTKLREYLPPGYRPSRSPEVDYMYSMRAGGPIPGSRIQRFYLGYAGSSQFIRTLDAATAFDAFEDAVRFDVAVASDQLLFVHAGAVGWNGRAIVIPAPSTHGKSRLVEALVRAGATYYSDEFAVIDCLGRVHPFAKPLTLRVESGATRRVTATELGGSIGSAPLPIGLVVSTQHEPGREWRPREGTPGEAVVTLFVNTARARIAPGPTLKALTKAVEGAVMLEGPRGDASATAHQLLEMLDGSEPRTKNSQTAAFS